jgi:biotin carboxyl carrier protein
MTFEIDLGGRARAVSVERAGPHRFRITVDGVPHLIDAVQPGPDLWSIVSVESGESHEVALTRGTSPGELVASVRGERVALVVNGRRVRRGGESGVAEGVHRVLAPMPGKVLRVLVKTGDEVAARQPLVVVEAMKMENELTAPRAGRVTDVTVEAGASVEAGRLLVVVE